MSLIRTVVENGRTYRIGNAETFVYRVLVTGRLVDAISGDPLRGDFTVRSDRAEVRVKIIPGGLFCAAGYSERLFPGGSAGSLTLFVSAPNFVERSITVAIPQNAAFPVPLGDVLLARPRIRVQGRAVDDANRQPVRDASVVSNIPSVLALRTPLRFDHAAGVTVEGRVLNLGAARRLIFDAPAGTRTLVLNALDTIGIGTTLQIGTAQQGEYAIVEDVPAFSVLLRGPLTRSFAAETPVRIATFAAAPGSSALSEAALTGDGLIRTAAALQAEFLEISDGSRTEHHAVGALTGQEGFYALSGIGGIREIVLLGSAPGFPAANQTPVALTLDYASDSNAVDFVLSP